MKLSVVLSSLTAMFISLTAIADGVPIDPGQWEMTSTMTMSMMPQPQVNTTLECIEEDELNPDSFEMDKDNPCEVTDMDIDGNTARWSIHCPTEAGPAMDGQWEFTSKGDSITGSGTLSMDLNGQEMGFTMNWEGKRVGDCE